MYISERFNSLYSTPLIKEYPKKKKKFNGIKGNIMLFLEKLSCIKWLYNKVFFYVLFPAHNNAFCLLKQRFLGKQSFIIAF